MTGEAPEDLLCIIDLQDNEEVELCDDPGNVHFINPPGATQDNSLMHENSEVDVEQLDV